MKTYKDLELYYMPLNIDDTTSQSTVYIRTNIRTIEKEDLMKLDESNDPKVYTVYLYDEIQMTHDEYKVYQLEQELINTSMAIITMYEASVTTFDVEAPNPYIVKVYKNMVDRDILDISEVPFKILSHLEELNA